VTATQATSGAAGNTTVTLTDSGTTGMSKTNFTGGDDATARVYGSETIGAINATDYTITGDASKHKYHRNNIEKIQFTGDDPRIETGGGPGFVTASFNDNAFVSHMIPRSDKQTRWITASII